MEDAFATLTLAQANMSQRLDKVIAKLIVLESHSTFVPMLDPSISMSVIKQGPFCSRDSKMGSTYQVNRPKNGKLDYYFEST